MRKLIVVCVALATLCSGVKMAVAQAAHTPEQVKAFVEKAVAFYKSEGKDKALPAFSDPHGQWVEGDLYLVVMDANDGKLTMLAHGTNKALIGKPQIDVNDADGKAFNKEMVATLSKVDEAWVSYKWSNPATRKIGMKRTYWFKAGDVIIGAGVYE